MSSLTLVPGGNVYKKKKSPSKSKELDFKIAAELPSVLTVPQKRGIKHALNVGRGNYIALQGVGARQKATGEKEGRG